MSKCPNLLELTFYYALSEAKSAIHLEMDEQLIDPFVDFSGQMV